MGKSKTVWIIGILVVGGIYYWLYKDSFKKAPMQVAVGIRPNVRARARPANTQNNTGQPDENVIFTLNGEYKLTAVHVYPLSDALTNKYPHAVWSMVSDSNSPPTSVFNYGMRVRGLHPEIKGVWAEPLAPATDYRVVVKAGSQIGQKDFKTLPE
jgi:hypothetical protein